MAGNTFGTLFKVSTFGESHGPAIGCVIDGCPAGLNFNEETLQHELKRRRPGGGGAATTRKEADQAEILSGIFQGKTLGTPIAIIIRNTAQHSADYDHLKEVYRPGHADWCWEAKYGIRDHNGGGRSSARETAARVAAGAVAKTLLGESGITIHAWTASIGQFHAPAAGEAGFDEKEIEHNPLRMPCAKTAAAAGAFIEELRATGDSTGGTVVCRVEFLPPGLGEPVFDKLDALIAHAILSLGAVKGIEFGSGFGAASARGSQNNDTPLSAQKTPRFPDGAPPLSFASNNAGGVLGGISTGTALEFRTAFKPVPSILQEQKTVNKDGQPCTLTIKGRHDVCVCPRAVPVVEAMTALVLADLLLQNRSSQSRGQPDFRQNRFQISDF